MPGGFVNFDWFKHQGTELLDIYTYPKKDLNVNITYIGIL